MKITQARVATVEVVDEDLIAGPVERLPMVRHITTLRLRTDQGLEGIGIAFAYAGLSQGLASVLEELAQRTVGQDPTRIEALTAQLHAHASTLNGSGLFLSALSAIDAALWDIKGKMAGLPLWRLLGGTRQRVPTYASGPLHRALDNDQVVAAAERIVAKGFRTVKMHLALQGNPTPAQELERARLVRAVVGPDVRLVCDINERWRVSQAIDIGRRLEEIGFFWIEDATRHDDYAGLARITDALSTPTMAGESCWGVTPFRHMLEQRAVDILMIDLMHVGGITPWLKIAGMAEAFNIPVVNHIMPEFQAQLVAAVPNGLIAEYKAWTWRLFDGVPAFDQGDFVLSERPGHGLSFSKEYENRV
ncbi:mandelate racemase/muconate lactonizing enzyme family protein [Pseudorhodoferax sp.]|uniref:mandelate racemase/muconate lactonizing enzyme family protein n=1 Tax=Pseudorhodoferax sp. TaxID=1993553 RepID=UPI002DD66905|nr:mandelate racemase/muconate lactonizing enzyme family protein [Pseudorhodoferax sp.]